jgi:hypothetical protein
MPDDAFGQHFRGRGDDLIRHDAPKHWGMVLYGAGIFVLMMFASIAPGADGQGKAATRATAAATQARKLPECALVVRQFHDDLRGARVAEALKLLATSPQPVRDAERRVKRLSASLSGANWDFSILDAKEAGEIAVVLIDDYLKDGRRTIDIKPWYLIRQEGQWKLLGKFTDFELKEYGFEAARIEAYRGLEKWANEREPQLRKEQPDCGC